MNDLNPPSQKAGEREAGAACPFCGGTVQFGVPVAVCRTCGTVHHRACWDETNQCGSYICAPGRRDLTKTNEPALVITAGEIQQAAPLPTRSSFTQTAPPTRPPAPPRTSRLAIAALVCAIAGIPLFGVLTGLVAIILGSVALGGIRNSGQKGTGLALVGVLLGLVDMVGWVVFLTAFWPGNQPHLTLADFRPDPTALEIPDPRINRAMRANVMIESRTGWGALGSHAIGSGVILKIAGGEAIIITNRHVVDPGFAGNGKGDDKAEGTNLQVRMVDDKVRQGHVIWIAPGGIDLALVRVALNQTEARAAHWKLGRPRPPVGAPVFAIGNPQGLGWTHTQGTVSQYRKQDLGGHAVPVIQTQTAINPGNSGGGLYDQDGYLLGIPTWTQDKRVAEGLNFAISLDILQELAPPDLNLKTGFEGPDQP